MKKTFKASTMTVAAALVLTASLLLVAAGCDVSTASLSDVKICDRLDDVVCSSDMSSLDKNIPTVYVTANLNSAPSGTKIKVDWRYLGGEEGTAPQDIDSIILTSEEDSTNLHSSLDSNTGAFPVGEYEVVLKIDTDNADPIHKKFTVK